MQRTGLHVIWDWNGTLWADQPIVLEGVNLVLEKAGGHAITQEVFRRQPKRPVRPFYERLLERPLSDAEWHELDHAYHDAYRDNVARVGFAPDALPALEAAAAAGASQSLLSMWGHDQLTALVMPLGIAHYFCRMDGLVGACGGEKADHLEEHLSTLEEHHGIPRRDVVMIGDTVDDAVASRLAGIRCVLVETDTDDRDILEAEGFPVVRDLVVALDVAGVADERRLVADSRGR